MNNSNQNYTSKSTARKNNRFNTILKGYVFLVAFVFVAVTLVSVVALLIHALTPKAPIFYDPDEVVPDASSNTEAPSEGSTSSIEDPIIDKPEYPVIEVNPGDYVYLDLYNDPIGIPYEAIDDIYKTFKTDNPNYKNYEEVRTIVIDPGHQSYFGIHPVNIWISPYLNPDEPSSWVNNHLTKLGATGISTGRYEYDIANIVAQKLRTELESRGYRVILTKEETSVLMYGAQRAAVANQCDANLMISLHCDAYGGSDAASVTGSLAQVPELWSGYPDKELQYLSSKAAAIILKQYCEETGMKNRGIQEIDKASMFTFCKVPVFLLEMGYMSNKNDDELLCSSTFQEKMIKGIADGIDIYFSALRYLGNGQ